MTRDFDPTPKTPEFQLDESQQKKLEVLTNRFEKLKIQTKYGIYSGDTLIDGKDVDQPIFAASTGKLALAEMAIHKLPNDNMVPVLLTLMLRDSSNDAYRGLGIKLGGPEAINAYYEGHEWTNSLVGTHPENGRALIGDITVKEAHAQMYSLLHDKSGNPQLRKDAQKALKENTVTRYGIRQLVSPDDDLTIYNKTGEHKKVRNDVGELTGPNGNLGYVILTEGPSKLANMAVAEFTATVAEMAGASKIPRSMGARAVFGNSWF